VSALDRGRGEESAVEERDAAEGARSAGALSGRGVEGAEEERSEDALVVLSLGAEAVGKRVGQPRAVVVEPSLGLEEGEEKEPAGVEEGDLVSGGVGCVSDGAGGERGDAVSDRAIEPSREAFAPEDIEASGVGEEVVAGDGRCLEGAEGFGIGVDDVVAVDDEGGGACAAGRCGRRAGLACGEDDVGAAEFDGGDQPEEVGVRRVSRVASRATVSRIGAVWSTATRSVRRAPGPRATRISPSGGAPSAWWAAGSSGRGGSGNPRVARTGASASSVDASRRRVAADRRDRTP